MNIKMTNITKIVNWHTGGTILDISLSLILSILKWNDSHPNKPHFSACDLLSYKGVSPSVNPFVTLFFTFCKGRLTQQPWPREELHFLWRPRCHPCQITRYLPTGLCWGTQRKFLCLFRTKSAILWNVDNPSNEEPFSSTNNRLGKSA